MIISLITYDANDDRAEYEYIVVGAGPAGIIAAYTLAKKLQEEAATLTNDVGKVLLLESGTLSQSSVEERIMHLYGGVLDTEFGIEEDRDQEVLEVNEFDIPLMWNKCNNRRVEGKLNYLSHHWPVAETFLGRAVGGSGIHNAMINVRALPSDFQKWNVSNWSPKEMEPYFNMLETFNKDYEEPMFWNRNETNKNRGMTGPLFTTPALDISRVGYDFVKSSLAANISLASLGFNDPDISKRVGVGFYEFNIRNGVRDSVAKALLTSDDTEHSKENDIPANLFIQTDATVKKIIFESINPLMPSIATGVQYFSSRRGRFDVAKLRSSGKLGERDPEVILSAGAILTPQILANSGVHEGGPIVDSKGVGKNLQDHPVVSIVYKMNSLLSEKIESHFDVDDKEKESFQNYLHSMGSVNFDENNSASSKAYGTAGISAGAFLVSPLSADTGIPDIQLTVFPHPSEPHFLRRRNDAMTNDAITNDDETNVMMVTVSLLVPEARNELKFAFNSYDDEVHSENTTKYKFENDKEYFEGYFHFNTPEIVTSVESETYLTERDVGRLAWGMEKVRKIMSMQPLLSNITGEIYPGSNVEGEDLRHFIIDNVMRNSHWCGSSRMGDDDESVVDERLRVRGVMRARVIDASVMPFIPNGNTHSTTCAVAMRGVDLVLGGKD